MLYPARCIYQNTNSMLPSDALPYIFLVSLVFSFFVIIFSCLEDVIESSSDDSNSTEIDIDIDEIIIGSKSWKSKGSKGGYYSYKSDKKSKKDKSDKKDKKSKSDDHPTIAPEPEFGFTPTVSWGRTFSDAIDTGFLFYDDVTKYAWYAYSAKVGEDDFISISSAESVDGSAQAVVAQTATSTIGRICPMDTANGGRVLETLCIKIKAPEEWKTVTSTKIQSAEACYGSVTGSIFKLAVIVEDSSKVLHLEESLVGSRMVVYDIVVGGKSAGSNGGEPIMIEVAYKGWKSLYGEPGINARPSFSPDCKMVYATWMTPLGIDGEEVINQVSSVTIATDIESAAKDGDSAEVWRLGTNGRLVGLTPSKDGKSLLSATNLPEDDTLNSSGVISLNAKTGQIEQQYVFPTNKDGLPNNAYTNPVMDDSGNTYHIDSLLGLVKFDSDDLNDGPVWNALEGATEEEMLERRNLAPMKDKTVKLIEEGEKAFTAFQPALDESDFATVYGCGNSALGNQVDGVTALSAKNGADVWFAGFTDHHVVNVGSCSGITDDIVWGPSVASSSGNAVYIARGDVVQALDSTDGSVLWTSHTHLSGPNGATKFVVASEKSVITANIGDIVGLETKAPPPPTPSPKPTTPAPNQPTMRPTRSPLATPSPVSMTGSPTAKPSSASIHGLSYAVMTLSALPLLLVLLR